MTEMLSEIYSLHLSHKFLFLDWSLVGKVNPEICGRQPLALAWNKASLWPPSALQTETIWGNSSPGGNCAQLAWNLSDLFHWNWFPVGLTAHQCWAVQAQGVLPIMHIQGSLHTHSSLSLPVPAHTLLRVCAFKISCAAGWAAQGIDVFPFHSRAVTNWYGLLVTNCAWRSGSLLNTSTRMLQNSSWPPTPLHPDLAKLWNDSWPCSIPTSYVDITPSHQLRWLRVAATFLQLTSPVPAPVLHHLQHCPVPPQLGKSGHRVATPTPASAVALTES